MKIAIVSALLATLASVQGFVPTAPSTSTAFARSSTVMQAKYKNMDEILALFPEDKPVLINFYNADTEKDIKDDIFRAKALLADRATMVSIKQQDYPELAKLWDCADKSPAMILFKDGVPATRLYGESHYLEIVAKMGQYCRSSGEEHKPHSK
jgi:hypothetical protein